MVGDTNVRAGQCHCGAVRFEATLSDGFNSIRRCTCSYCRMRGAVVVMAEMGGIKLLQGEDALTSYRFHTGAAQHFFCSRCGIYTHHQRRSNQNLYAVNVACLDGVSPFDFSDVPVMDGVNHTNDTGLLEGPNGESPISIPSGRGSLGLFEHDLRESRIPPFAIILQIGDQAHPGNDEG